MEPEAIKAENELDLDSLPLLHHELFDIRGKWYDFGVQLGIDDGTLQTIRHDFSADSGAALREVLTYWLKRSSPTWKALLKALRSRPVGAPSIAESLQKHALLLPQEVTIPEAPVQYTNQMLLASGRHYGVDSHFTVGSPPVSVGPFTRVPEFQNPIAIEGVHIPFVESGTSLGQELSMMKMPLATKVRCDHKFKVIIVGESGVGKTSILNRFLKPEVAIRSLQVTIEPMKAEGSVVIKVDENFYVKLMIWDTVGMERLFNTIPDNLFRDVHAALIVFDVREKDSFVRAVSDQCNGNGIPIKSWFKTVNHRCGDVPPIKILIGNMIDCEEKIRKVSKDKAAGVASQLGVDYIETSSLENINIDKVFFRLTELLLERVRSRGNSRPLTPNSGTVLNLNTRRHRPKCSC